jgi:DNA-binding winged helix-turn-helix (wHTH) protein
LSSGLRFGRFEVRPDERQLLVDGAAAPLGSRAFDLLIALVERRDRVVGKNELLDLVWPGMVVEENNLQVQVNTLRKLLGPQAIATVPGRGYRFTLASQQGATEPLSSGLPGDVLPRLLTSFVGREAELETLARLLDTSRLLSLTGIGGSGKTRLAIELGEVAQGATRPAASGGRRRSQPVPVLMLREFSSAARRFGLRLARPGNPKKGLRGETRSGPLHDPPAPRPALGRVAAQQNGKMTSFESYW